MNDGQRNEEGSGKDRMPSGDTAATMKEPTDTDHPTGEQQAKENRETESPS
jgi:hypothetical protein